MDILFIIQLTRLNSSHDGFVLVDGLHTTFSKCSKILNTSCLSLYRKQLTKALIRLNGSAGSSAPLFFACNKVRFSHIEAHTGADPGFLERGFICINVWGVRFADLISFFLNIP